MIGFIFHSWLKVSFESYDTTDFKYRWITCAVSLGPDSTKSNFLPEEFAQLKNDLDAYSISAQEKYTFVSMEENIRISMKRNEENFLCDIEIHNNNNIFVCSAKFWIKKRHLEEFINDLLIFNEELEYTWLNITKTID